MVIPAGEPDASAALYSTFISSIGNRGNSLVCWHRPFPFRHAHRHKEKVLFLPAIMASGVFLFCFFLYVPLQARLQHCIERCPGEAQGAVTLESAPGKLETGFCDPLLSAEATTFPSGLWEELAR